MQKFPKPPSNYYNARSVADLQKFLEDSPIKRVHITCTDLGGTLRSKIITKAECIKTLGTGTFTLCDLILVWDPNDLPYPEDTCAQAQQFSSYATGFPDLHLRALPKLFSLPEDSSTGILMIEIQGRGEHLCPRAILRQMVDRLAEHKLQCKIGVELEFWVFAESFISMLDKDFQKMKPISAGNFTWSALRSLEHSEFYTELLDYLTSLGIPISTMHTETGAGALELSLTPSDPLEVADLAILAKHFIKVFCAKRGWLATFMAKWNPDCGGSGLHVHYSVQDSKGKSVLFDENCPKNMSDIMNRCIIGQMQSMHDFTVLSAPNINSYARFYPYHFAPYYVGWGFDNRTTALRALLGKPEAQRLEYRVPGADANPYLALASVLGTILHGLNLNPTGAANATGSDGKKTIEVPPPCLGNSYEKRPDQKSLPLTLESAARAFQKSEIARSLFDPRFVDHYSQLKLAETVVYARTVNSWQLRRYLDFS